MSIHTAPTSPGAYLDVAADLGLAAEAVHELWIKSHDKSDRDYLRELVASLQDNERLLSRMARRLA